MLQLEKTHQLIKRRLGTDVYLYVDERVLRK